MLDTINSLMELLIQSGYKCESAVDIYATIKHEVNCIIAQKELRILSHIGAVDYVPGADLKPLIQKLINYINMSVSGLDQHQQDYVYSSIIGILKNQMSPIYTQSYTMDEAFSLVINQLGALVDAEQVHQYNEAYKWAVNNSNIKHLVTVVNSDSFWQGVSSELKLLQERKLEQYTTKAALATKQ